MTKNDYNYNEIVFVCGECYGGDHDLMWKDILDFQRILIRAGYVCKVYPDGGDPDFIVVEYACLDEEVSEGPLRWTTWGELDILEPEESAYEKES